MLNYSVAELRFIPFINKPAKVVPDEKLDTFVSTQKNYVG